MGIEDDLYFIAMVQNSWRINPYYSKVSTPQSVEGGENVSYSQGELRNKKIRVEEADTDMTPLTEFVRKKTFYPVT